MRDQFTNTNGWISYSFQECGFLLQCLFLAMTSLLEFKPNIAQDKGPLVPFGIECAIFLCDLGAGITGYLSKK